MFSVVYMDVSDFTLVVVSNRILSIEYNHSYKKESVEYYHFKHQNHTTHLKLKTYDTPVWWNIAESVLISGLSFA